MKTTENYGFNKPEGDDVVDIEQISSNFEKIDKMFGTPLVDGYYIDAANSTNKNITLLDTNLKAESDRATKAESTLQTNITNENKRAVGVEGTRSTGNYYKNTDTLASADQKIDAQLKTTNDNLSAETKRADAAEKANKKAIEDESARAQKAEKVNADAIAILNGAATTKGSVAYQIAEIVDENDNSTIDTLKEIAAWINNNPNSATAMQASITENKGTIDNHKADKANPHGVTKVQVGLGNVDNTSDANKPVSTAQQAALDKKANASDLTAHIGNKANPHGVTKAQVGLGNVDNTSDANKPISTAAQEALDKITAVLTDLVVVEDVTIETATIGDVGSVDISASTPTKEDYTLLSASVVNFESNLKKTVNVTADGKLLLGTEADVITNIVIRYIFAKTSVYNYTKTEPKGRRAI